MVVPILEAMSISGNIDVLGVVTSQDRARAVKHHTKHMNPDTINEYNVYGAIIS